MSPFSFTQSNAQSKATANPEKAQVPSSNDEKTVDPLDIVDQVDVLESKGDDGLESKGDDVLESKNEPMMFCVVKKKDHLSLPPLPSCASTNFPAKVTCLQEEQKKLLILFFFFFLHVCF